MGRPLRAILVGGKKVGKTAILSQFACGQDICTKPYIPTVGDSYIVHIDHDKTRDYLILMDTPGLDGTEKSLKSLLQPADFVLFVCAVDNAASLTFLESVNMCVEQLQKEKKDLVFLVLVNKCDPCAEAKYEKQYASIVNWCMKEKVRCFKVDPRSLKSVAEPFKYLVTKYFSAKDSRFSLPKKSKEKTPGAAILLDF
ncbi:hypothetical protein M514_03494 [Trichuris suis]|uniref:Miro-like protein n=1 Tax=Trichuris suis TaxID=68888 RepID=A0A085NDL9_9BILA|nr:hypothetical protein M513_03494 [Trichuris suis]KFD67565.1 hypothetical protein M514_03494 [Trichuris suis]